MCEPSNTPTMSYESRIGSGNQQRKPGRKSARTAPQNFWRSRGKTTPLRRPSTDRRTCLISAQNMHLKTGARQRKDMRGFVSSCSLRLCGRSTKTFPHSWMTCLQIDSLSHWTLHDIVFHSARFSALRQLMPNFTRESIIPRGSEWPSSTCERDTMVLAVSRSSSVARSKARCSS